MPEQLSFTELAPPQATDRLFFALHPDLVAVTQIAQLARDLRRQHGLTGKPLAADRFHITLCFLGDHAGLPQNIVDAATEVATSIIAPPLEIVLDRVKSFSRSQGGKPLVLLSGEGAAVLAEFQRVLAAAMGKTGLGRREKSFVPHLTLLYDERPVAEHAVDPIVWTAREFVLVHSLLGRSRHTTLARFPLRA